MKIYKIILLFSFFVFICGCNTKEIIYQNQTIEVEVIKECPIINCPDCVCQTQTCPEFKEKECKTVIDTSSNNKLNLCNIRLDTLNNQLFTCMISNNTRKYDNLSIEFNKCQIEKKEIEDVLNNITNLI